MTHETPDTLPRYPALRSAGWLYLIVLVLTGAVVILAPLNLDPRLLRLLAALILAGGGTIFAILISGAHFGAVFGRPPRVSGLLDLSLGFLPPPRALQAGVTPAALAIQFGLLVPLCQGVLFWAYIQRAAEGIGGGTGAVFTAVLFALYGLVSAEFGMRIIPAYLLIGLAAAFAGYFTESAWCGIAVLIGYSLMRALFEESEPQIRLFQSLGAESAADLVNARWLFAVAVTLFTAFATIQILRALHARDSNPPRSVPRRLWWIPTVLALLVCLVISYGEISTRQQFQRRLTPNPSSNSTVLPVPTPGR
jgi:hypothetical protein